MLKSKILTGLLILTIVFCLHLNGPSIAGDCDDLEHSKGTPIITGDHSYPAGWLCTADPDIEYDTENSSETVDRNDSATILVIGNNAPFTWTISGTGFWFDSGYTQTTINTTGNVAVVYADNTACGSATITVTGCDGTVATGGIRCTEGQWILTHLGEGLLCDGGDGDERYWDDGWQAFRVNKTEGKYKTEWFFRIYLECRDDALKSECAPLEFDCDACLASVGAAFVPCFTWTCHEAHNSTFYTTDYEHNACYYCYWVEYFQLWRVSSDCVESWVRTFTWSCP